jgi:hypothetical protein
MDAVSDDITEKDLRLGADDDPVFMLEFSTQWFLFQLGNARLTLRAPFEIAWADGTSESYDPATSATNPASAKLLAALIGARVSSSVAGKEHAYLRIAFDNGVRLSYDPTGSADEDWEATDPSGVLYVALPDDDLTWFADSSQKAE